MNVKNRTRLSGQEFEAYRNELQDHRSLQDVLRWSEQQPQGVLLPGVIADFIVQDEFTHDLVLPWRGFFIVYGTT